MGKLIYKKPAFKFLDKHKNQKEAYNIVQAFEELSEDWIKYSKSYDIKPMVERKPENKGFKVFRLRERKYRALFELNEIGEIVIIVIDIDSRGDIYK